MAIRVHLHQQLMRDVMLLRGQVDQVARSLIAAHAAGQNVVPLAVAI